MDLIDQEKAIADLQAQNNQLQAELIRAKNTIHELGAELSTYFAVERGLRFELEKQTYLANEQLTDAINSLLESSQRCHEQSVIQVNHWKENIYQVASERPLDPFIDAIVSLAILQYEFGAKNLEPRLNHLGERYGLTDAELQNPNLHVSSLLALERAGALIEAATINNNTVGFLTRAHDLAGDPAIVAFAILEECKRGKGLSLTTVQRLYHLPKSLAYKIVPKNAWDKSSKLTGKKQQQN